MTDEDETSGDFADGAEPYFSMIISLFIFIDERIVEDTGSRFESDTVLLPIGRSLCRIPIKMNPRHSSAPAM